MFGLLWFLAGVFVTGAGFLARKLAKDLMTSKAEMFDFDQVFGHEAHGHYEPHISSRRLRPHPPQIELVQDELGKTTAIVLPPLDCPWIPKRPERKMPDGFETESAPMFDAMFDEWRRAGKRIPEAAKKLARPDAGDMGRKRPGGRNSKQPTRAQRRRVARQAHHRAPAPGRTPVGDRNDL